MPLKQTRSSLRRLFSWKMRYRIIRAPRFNSRLGWTLLALSFLTAAVLLVWRVPRLILDHDVGQKESSFTAAELAVRTNNVRTTLLQALGGLALVFGVLGTWRQLHLSQNAHLVQTFTETVDQLRSEDTGVRTGAIYALGLTGQPLNRVRIVADTLGSWVRRYPTPEPSTEAIEVVSDRLRNRAPDLQIALEVLMGLKLPRGAYLRLSYADLQRATLRNAQLEGADLRYSRLDGSDLRRANLRGAHLDGASLVDADLVWADLRGAKFSDKTNWRGAKIDLNSRKLPRDLDPEAAGMEQQSPDQIPRGFREPRDPTSASKGKFGG